MSNLSLICVLSKEDASLREFISHLYEDAVGNFLVARLQDKRFSSTRFEQIFLEEVEM